MDNLLTKKKDKKEKDERQHRSEKKVSMPSFGKSAGSKSKDRTSNKQGPQTAPKPARFETTIESAPLVMYGSPSQSSGALLSTQIKLVVQDPSGQVTLTKWKRTLRAIETSKRPVHRDCKACTERVEILSEAEIISKPKTYSASDDNTVPFQHLFNGRLPASTVTQLGSVMYELLLEATTSEGQEITYQKELILHRAIPEGQLKSSIRIFPPTNLTGRVQLPPVVHPIGQFPVTMTLSGVVEKKASASTRWRLRKLMWRVEEHSKVTSTPCSKHASKVPEGKAVQHTDTRVIGSDEIKSGWKTDFDTIGGEINIEFDASVATKPTHKPVCDMESASGISVTHNLVLELIVAEEFCANKNPSVITPTGAARVLRMQFGLNVTERAGMGISWDEEMPPVYEDVPDSPPGYGLPRRRSHDSAEAGAEILDYEGPELEYTDLERLPSTDPSMPPLYRERAEPTVPAITEDGPSTLTRRIGGFSLDDISAEHPAYRRRSSADAETTENNEADIDYAEGSAN
jgi:arrestin-related trafficking adapter 1